MDIYNIPIQADLIDIFGQEGIEKKRSKFNKYKYNDMNVPRVNEILKECINNDYLQTWAAKLGYNEWKAATYKATSIGTAVHEKIEEYLKSGEDYDISFKTTPDNLKIINRCFNNFKLWMENLVSLGYEFELVATELEVTCPYYGGTIDCIAKINDAYYIIDYKTSRQINWSYVLQCCAYRWIINNGYSNLPITHIDGIGIIRVDKEKDNTFNDYFLTDNIEEQKSMLMEYEYGFLTLLNTFYNNINLQHLFSKSKSKYSINTI